MPDHQQARTRVSLRRFFALVTYLVILLFLVIPSPRSEPYSQPLTWVYYFARATSQEVVVWHHAAAGVLLLVGTVLPFFRTRWWTLIIAALCGALYALIGLSGANKYFTV